MFKPSNKIDPSKIKSFKYFINQIQEQHPELNIPKHALLIGAGCSYKCGIPLGGQLIEICKIHAFIKNEIVHASEFLKDCTNKYDVSELEKFLKDKKEFENYESYVVKKIEDLKIRIDKDAHLKRIKTIFGEFHEGDKEKIWKEFEYSVVQDSQYGFWMDEYSEDPLERQKLIEKLIDDKQPNGAYILLAYLIEQSVFTNLLTTNFDDLINEALIYYTEKRCRFYADDEISQYISIHSKKPNIIKVHGDYRYANIRNTNDETDKLSENIGIKLKELLSQLGLIVVGYNGADHSIMSVLYEIKRYSKYPLLWCGINPDNVHWRVAQLINNTANSYFIKIEGFDEMIGLIAPTLFRKPLEYNFLEKAKTRVKEVEDYLNKFKIEFKQSSASDEEKEILENTLDIWDSFNQATNSSDIQKRLELYTRVIEMDSDFELAYHNRGYVYSSLGDYERAIGDFQKYKELIGEDKRYFNGMADTYKSMGNLLEAIKLAKKGIELYPEHVILYGTLAEIYGLLKDENMFYLALEEALVLGFDVLKYIEDDAYEPYKNQDKFKHLLKKYNIQ